MNVDISKIIDSPSGIAIQLLYTKGLKFTDYQKMMLVSHWNSLGSPENLRVPLLSILGSEADLFLNPFLVKLLNTPFYSLMVKTSGFESLEDPKYKKVLKAIFDKKLDVLSADVAKHGYRNKIKKIKHSATSQSMTFEIQSVSVPYELYYFSASVEGYKYTPAIKLFNRPEDLTHLLTEQSITNLKGIMFYMTENENWDQSLLPRTIKFIEFKSAVLSSLSESIIDKYYDIKMEEKLRPKEEEDDTLGGLGLLDKDDDDDDDDDIDYGSGFNINDYI